MVSTTSFLARPFLKSMKKNKRYVLSKNSSKESDLRLTSPLLALPTEILHSLLFYLEPKDILNFSSVNHQLFYHCSNSEDLWKCRLSEKVRSIKKMNQLIKEYDEWYKTPWESKKIYWFWKSKFLNLKIDVESIPTYRLVVVGDSGVGKSPLIVRLIQNHFKQDYDPTIGDVYQKQFAIDGEPYILEIMDTSGVYELRANTDYYIRQGQGFVIVYSIIRRTSFDSVLEWYDQIREEKDAERVPMVLVGTHCDLAEEREISIEEGENLARRMGCRFFETSAKEMVGVQEVFFSLIREMNSYYEDMDKTEKKRRRRKRRIKSLKSVLYSWSGKSKDRHSST
eukprot:TRINITY_DN6219_c0_g2_i2.p1 TRINITY_DN6219_c0_g2~~TRINITY_DN6219_c0_g2_i2.p1  ORF type:complete len:339 (-),score=52.94 TRINITY_DN6219_c0_g2_i2:100-1116(-)